MSSWDQQPAYVEATFYVQLRAKQHSHWKDAEGNKILEGAGLAAATVTKPTRPRPGTVMAKLTIRVPSTAFLPLLPKAIVTVPADMLVGTPIEVEATAADEEPSDG